MKRLDAAAADFEAVFAGLLNSADQAAPSISRDVAAIIAQVRSQGDAALFALTAQFDRTAIDAANIRVSDAEVEAAQAEIGADLHAALDLAASRIEAFAQAQMPNGIEYTDTLGVRLGMRWTPLDAVGIYVPGGKATYPSSVLMNALPAKVAGVGRIAMCVPMPGGVINPLVLAAARRAGVTEIYRIGGAQAVAALAYGTASIASVDRIVGPGNAYVAEAKRQVFGPVGIDSIAGPSNVLIIADAANDPAYIALDLLAQAEHDELAQSILITNDADFADLVARAVDAALVDLPRAAIAGASWRDHGAIIVVQNWTQAASLADRIAPEHLQLMLANHEPVFAAIRHAGAIFLGGNCPEAIGDYIAGPNHVLPTSRAARYASGLSVHDFLKRTTYVALSDQALGAIGPAAVVLAQAEGLDAHARSVACRLKSPLPG